MATRPLHGADVPQVAPDGEALVAGEVLARVIGRETAWRFGKIRLGQIKAGISQLADQAFNVLACLCLQPLQIGPENRS